MEGIAGIERLGYALVGVLKHNGSTNICYSLRHERLEERIVLVLPEATAKKEIRENRGENRFTPAPFTFEEVDALVDYIWGPESAGVGGGPANVDWGRWASDGGGLFVCVGWDGLANHEITVDVTAGTVTVKVGDGPALGRTCWANADCLRKAAEGVLLFRDGRHGV